jgi:RNA polymerase sigma-70 factor (ECF subfamily)
MVSERAGPLQMVLPDEISEDREEACQVERARSGERAAIDWLLARYRNRVVRLASHILRRPEEAEDVAQEAFVRAFRNLHSYRAEGRFYTWLYQIVVRVCLDRRRLSRWEAEAPLENVPDFMAVSDAALDEVELRLLVENLLDRLSPPMRAMLVLRELEGLEYEEIARVLQIPVGRVRWRLHTARAQFQKLWLQIKQEAENA